MMRRAVRSSLFAVAGLAWVFVASSPGAFAQEDKPTADVRPAAESTDKPAGPTAEQRQLRELLLRLEKLEAELGRLKAGQGQLPADKKEQKVLILLETPYLGTNYYGGPNTRYFAARLILINLTPQPVTLKRDDVRLDADGAEFVIKEPNQQAQFSASFQVGGESFSLRNLKTPPEVKIAAGGTATTWVVFTELPAGGQTPKLALHLVAGEQKIDVDVNQHALALLGMDVERIGPRQSLGLITIGGSLNTINAGSLADVLDNLALQKVARVVVRWTQSAGPVDNQALNWLAQAAQMSGRGEVQNTAFPSIPASIRELHLAATPGQAAENYRQPNQPLRIHKTDAEAVAAALQTAYEVLPLDELANEIEQGSPLTRAAALAGGGGRLHSDRLPLILKHCDGDDPSMQRAALIALRHFGEPEAIAKLEQYALKNTEPLATTAVESLAASRFPTAHQKLLGLLKSETAPARKKIVAVLAQYPRPIWSETIYEFVTDPNSGLGVDGLRALALVGHPRLQEVFEKSLTDRSVEVRNEAFNLLSTRVDSASEELALKFTLEHLKNAPPTPQMTNLLNRTKDPRSLPLLLALFEKQPNNRASLINTLAVVGDQSVADVLAKEYPRLRTPEQTAVLNALIQLKSPEFRKLAAQAVTSSDFSLVNAASNGLQADGSPEAIRILVDAFEKSSNQNTMQYVASALSNSGTPEARASLLKARASTDATRRNLAVTYLRTLYQRSPGYTYVTQAQNHSQQEQWKEAIQHYKLAIEIDPDLPDAYAGRANAYLKQNMNKEAKADYAKASELDPWNSQAVTGLGVLMVLEGDRDGGVKKVEDSRSKFPNDPLFAYNAACVYSQAFEAVRKDEKAPDREKKLEEYRRKALDDLKQSVQLGFQDFEWMNKDPDLVPLHDIDEFKEVAKPDPNRAAARRRGVRIPKL